MENEYTFGAAPFFKKFYVKGLNGYKSVGIECGTSVKIACADNGAGKTSLLNAMYAVFEGRPNSLYPIDFDSIDITWADGETSTHKKSELFGSLDSASLDAMADDRLFSQWGDVDKADAIELLTRFIWGEQDEVVENKVYKEIYQSSPFDREDILERLSAITEDYITAGTFKTLAAKAKQALQGAAVLYLPTYRRIEADLPEFRTTSSSRSPFRGHSRVSKDAWSSSRLIFFGMRDVEAKLTSIVTQIRKETLEAYSRSNGQTLEQLLESVPEAADNYREAFDLESIEVVLSRVGKNTPELRGMLAGLISSEQIYDQRWKELRRFLNQLLKVYAERREDEQAIERFVATVNKYLCPSESVPSARSEKMLTFDKVKLELAVINTITGKELKFGHLSSGEKQVVSIFARIMLDPRKRYLILVDEPELSLSLDWQQLLLPDICATQNFAQLIAITHSPFIFDNELSLAAGTINTTYIKDEKRHAKRAE